jgi:hypothetical protein
MEPALSASKPTAMSIEAVSVETVDMAQENTVLLVVATVASLTTFALKAMERSIIWMAALTLKVMWIDGKPCVELKDFHPINNIIDMNEIDGELNHGLRDVFGQEALASTSLCIFVWNFQNMVRATNTSAIATC